MMALRNNLRRSALVLLMSIVFLGAFFVVWTQEVSAAKTYPKKANTFLKWTLTKDEAKKLAKWDLVVLDMEIQERHPDLLKQLRVWNPDIILLAYITPQEIIKNPMSSHSIMRKRFAQDIDKSWYLTNAQGERLSRWPGTFILNVSGNSQNINGKNYREHLVQFVDKEILATGLWDGVFYDNAWDNITYFAGTDDIDFDGDGHKDDYPDATWRSGMKWIYEQTRLRQTGEIILVGNNTTDAYLDYLDGMLVENFANFDWSYFMNAYKRHASKPGSFNIFNANARNIGDKFTYQWMRFGLTSSLLENGFFSYDYGDQNHAQTWWYDEYDTNLGQPSNPAYSLHKSDAYQKDIWRRDFDQGISVVNSTDDDATISLGEEFEKIHGTQDTQVNDGSIVSELTLEAQDGRVLLKTFDDLHGIPFENGSFARFLDGEGRRIRNGHFVFDEQYPGGNILVHLDLDNNQKEDFIRLRNNKLMAWRDDGQLFLREYPYTVRNPYPLTLAVGDIYGDAYKEIIVAPKEGSGPIHIYTLDGRRVVKNWFPFGRNYVGGYSVAIDEDQKQIIVGQANNGAYVAVYNQKLERIRAWSAFNSKKGVRVAVGDVLGLGESSVITAAAGNTRPIIRIFAHAAKTIISEFSAFTFFGFGDGISDIGTLDHDFDGVDDVVVFTEGI